MRSINIFRRRHSSLFQLKTLKQIKMIKFPLWQKDRPVVAPSVFWADSGSKMCILILDYGSAYCPTTVGTGPLPAAR